MNVVDKYILENLDENIIVVTNAKVGNGLHGPSQPDGIEISGIGILRHGESFLIEKECVKHILRAYGSTWAQIDYLHKYDATLTSKPVYGLQRYFYNLKLDSKGRYNGYYNHVPETTG